MKYLLKTIVVISCTLFASIIIGHPAARIDIDGIDAPTMDRITDQPTNAQKLRQGSVLFVEDPGNEVFGPLTKPDIQWTSVLDQIFGANNYGWHPHTHAMSEDGPSLDTMQLYELVIWNTYDYWWHDTAALTTNDQDNIANYLESGGKVWLIGQDLLYSGVPLDWLSDYFHLADTNADYVTEVESLTLQGTAEISGIDLVTVADFQYNNFFPDELIPDAQAHAVVLDADSNKVVSILYAGTDWMSSFWTVDGRAVEPWDQWVTMVTEMLNAFGMLNIAEHDNKEPVYSSIVSISPMPMTTQAAICYYMSDPRDVKLQIFDNTGRQVITLVDDFKNKGAYRITWNGKDGKGMDVACGVYFLRLTCCEYSTTASLIVVK